MNSKNYSRVFLVRHGEHGEGGLPRNVLTEEGLKQLYQAGQKIRELGIKFTSTTTSPAWRAVETARHLLIVTCLKDIGYVRTDDRLGDLGVYPQNFPRENFTEKKEKLIEKGLSKEDAGLQVAQSQPFKTFFNERAEKAAEAIKHTASHFGNHLITSHSLSVIESTLITLQGKSDPIGSVTKRDLFQLGEVKVLTFEIVDVEQLKKIKDSKLIKVQTFDKFINEMNEEL